MGLFRKESQGKINLISVPPLLLWSKYCTFALQPKAAPRRRKAGQDKQLAASAILTDTSRSATRRREVKSAKLVEDDTDSEDDEVSAPPPPLSRFSPPASSAGAIRPLPRYIYSVENRIERSASGSHLLFCSWNQLNLLDYYVQLFHVPPPDGGIRDFLMFD